MLFTDLPSAVHVADCSSERELADAITGATKGACDVQWWFPASDGPSSCRVYCNKPYADSNPLADVVARSPLMIAKSLCEFMHGGRARYEEQPPGTTRGWSISTFDIDRVHGFIAKAIWVPTHP